jgi:His-Xaa-Ser system radical SAM maturase HxsC
MRSEPKGRSTIPAHKPFVARVSEDERASGASDGCARAESEPSEASGFRAYLVRECGQGWRTAGGAPIVPLPVAADWPASGDIVRVDLARRRIRTLFRPASAHNSLFVTERCNNDCVMCCQPPKKGGDAELLRECFDVVRLAPRTTRQLGITGGEPTLLGGGLVELLRHCRACLPETALHLLSNARLFKYLTFAQAVAEVEHPDLMLGVPLNSCIANEHDFIVQARGAFDEAVRGILNLARCDLAIEIRVVVQRANVQRLPALARFIARNLPFVRQVALMGLELEGYARLNLHDVWADPVDYAGFLAEAVEELHAKRLRPLIFNHQLCTLPRALWPFAVQSISDHKNVHHPECGSCGARAECGGFFAASAVRRSRGIAPVN